MYRYDDMSCAFCIAIYKKNRDFSNRFNIQIVIHF
nr:MAG TPA: glutathione-S-transferase, mitochondrial [Caudoviricetes sp.]DAK89920.1 MAG TPA: glutathione-S-transferase, mitochondrial [Caudoviricetes sp.]